MGKLSQRKGAQGERELAALLHEALGVDTKRGTILYGGSADVEGLPFVHIECKRVENLSLYKAFEQSERDAEKTGEIPTVHIGAIESPGSWLCRSMIGCDFIVRFQRLRNRYAMHRTSYRSLFGRFRAREACLVLIPVAPSYTKKPSML